MKKVVIFVEGWLIKLIIIQFICLIIGQFLMQYHSLTPYLNKTIRDEGVVKQTPTPAIETMVRQRSLWYYNK